MQWLTPGAMEPNQVQIQPLLHTGCLTLGKLLSLSRLLLGLNEILPVKLNITAPWYSVAIITTSSITVPVTIISFTQAAKHF